MKPSPIWSLHMARPKSLNKYVPLDVRIPPEVKDAIETAAKARYETLSAYARNALLARLEQDGICPIPQRAA
jgi:uncharacterized protein (DUF1778 family)